MVHLYALVDHPARLPEGSELFVAEAVDVDAVYGVDDGAAGDEAVLAHARIVEELAAVNDAVLPARFPGRYADGAALLTAVGERAPQFREALDRVRGRVEMGVRVLRETAAAHEAAPSGGDYLRRRLADVREGERLAAELAAAADRLGGEATDAVTATGDLVLSGAYLLPRDAAEPFRADVHRLAGEHRALTYVCVGPWPPYSFALVDGARA